MSSSDQRTGLVGATILEVKNQRRATHKRYVVQMFQLSVLMLWKMPPPLLVIVTEKVQNL